MAERTQAEVLPVIKRHSDLRGSIRTPTLIYLAEKEWKRAIKGIPSASRVPRRASIVRFMAYPPMTPTGIILDWSCMPKDENEVCHHTIERKGGTIYIKCSCMKPYRGTDDETEDTGPACVTLLEYGAKLRFLCQNAHCPRGRCQQGLKFDLRIPNSTLGVGSIFCACPRP